jgi:hypothetical protein
LTEKLRQLARVGGAEGSVLEDVDRAAELVRTAWDQRTHIVHSMVLPTHESGAEGLFMRARMRRGGPLGIRHERAAAVLQGAARRLALAAMQGRGPGEGGSTSGSRGGFISELRRDTTRRLADHPGDARLRELRADGDAMAADHAVAHALALTDRALATA